MPFSVVMAKESVATLRQISLEVPSMPYLSTRSPQQAGLDAHAAPLSQAQSADGEPSMKAPVLPAAAQPLPAQDILPGVQAHDIKPFPVKPAGATTGAVPGAVKTVSRTAIWLKVAVPAVLAALVLLLGISVALGLQLSNLSQIVEAQSSMQPTISTLQAELASKDTQVNLLTQQLTESKADAARLRDQDLPAVHQQYKMEVERMSEEFSSDLSALTDKLLEQLHAVRAEVSEQMPVIGNNQVVTQRALVDEYGNCLYVCCCPA